MLNTIRITFVFLLFTLTTIDAASPLPSPTNTAKTVLLEYIRLTHQEGDFRKAYTFLATESRNAVSETKFVQSAQSLSALSMAPQIPTDYLDMASRISKAAHAQTTYSIISSSSDGITAYLTVRFIMPDMESITMDIFSEMLDPSRYSDDSIGQESTAHFLTRLEEKMRTANRVALDQVYTLILENSEWKVLIDFRLQEMLSALMANSQSALSEGDFSGALKMLERVLELDSANPQAIQQLEKVKQMKRTQTELDNIRGLLESGSNSQARDKLEALLDNPALDPSMRPIIDNLLLLLDLNSNDGD